MNKKLIFGLFLVLVAIVLGGFKLYEMESVKGDDTRLIVAFGDSLTYGKGDEHGAGYIDTLETILNEDKQQKYDFENEAIYGLESSGVLNQLSDLRITRKLDNANEIILFIGTNDLINSNGGNYKDMNEANVKDGKEVFLKNLEAILKIIRERNERAPILLLGLYNPYPDSKQIESVIDDWNEEIKQIIHENSNIVFIPTNDLFKGKQKKEYFSDSLHLNDKGYKLVARRILEKYPFE